MSLSDRPAVDRPAADRPAAGRTAADGSGSRGRGSGPFTSEPSAPDLSALDHLAQDRLALGALLESARVEALRFLEGLDDRPVAREVPAIEPLGLQPTGLAPTGLTPTGLGAAGALEAFRSRYGDWVSGSAGPRYWAFVTGGATPAALVGDWLTSAFDQNLADAGESGSRQIALDALGMVRDLLGLPDTFTGAFVTGATTSSTVALAVARQWVGRARGVDVSRDGLAALGPVPVLSGTAHSSIPKALSVIGLGRAALRSVATLPEREALDVEALGAALDEIARDGTGPAIVVANAGTVNTCDFDDLEAIAALHERHEFWLHVDGAFGAVAAASPRFRGLVNGLEAADSVTVDAHKWLNVPYDSALVFTRHLALQGTVFQSAGAYLPATVDDQTFLHLTPENSQRLRALATWMTLAAYGRAGYAALVERCCDLAAWMGARIDETRGFRLLAPVRLNGVCFTLDDPSEVVPFLERLRADGTVFLTPTTYRGVSAIRISIANWRTQPRDAERAWDAMQQALG